MHNANKILTVNQHFSIYFFYAFWVVCLINLLLNKLTNLMRQPKIRRQLPFQFI